MRPGLQRAPQPSVLPIPGHFFGDALPAVASPAHRQPPAIAVGAPSTPNARPHRVLLHGEATLPDAAWGSDLPQWKICPPPHPSAVYRAERLRQPRTKGPRRNNGGSTEIATKPQTKGRGDGRRERGREQHPLRHAVPLGCLGQGRGAWRAICEPRGCHRLGTFCSRVTALGARRCCFHHQQRAGGVLAARRLLPAHQQAPHGHGEHQHVPVALPRPLQEDVTAVSCRGTRMVPSWLALPAARGDAESCSSSAGGEGWTPAPTSAGFGTLRDVARGPPGLPVGVAGVTGATGAGSGLAEAIWLSRW